MAKSQTADASGVYLVVDVDETLLNPLARWAERVNDRFGWHIEVAQVEMAGSWDNLMIDHPQYDAFSTFADFLRADPDFNYGLDPVDGALDALENLCGLPNVTLGCYLTTRPVRVAQSTTSDLRRLGFPAAPVIARPEGVDRSCTIEWKISELEHLLKTEPRKILIIDDNLGLGERLCERNEHAMRSIISIVFLGPLTIAEVHERHVESRPDRHFYVADWKQIDAIVRSYAAV